MSQTVRNGPEKTNCSREESRAGVWPGRRRGMNLQDFLRNVRPPASLSLPRGSAPHTSPQVRGSLRPRQGGVECLLRCLRRPPPPYTPWLLGSDESAFHQPEALPSPAESRPLTTGPCSGCGTSPGSWPVGPNRPPVSPWRQTERAFPVKPEPRF